MKNLSKLKAFIDANRRPIDRSAYTSRQLHSLVTIYEGQRLNMSEIARRCDIPVPQIGKIVQVLKDDGHVTVRQSTDGGHLYEVDITSSGSEFLMSLCTVLG